VGKTLILRRDSIPIARIALEACGRRGGREAWSSRACMNRNTYALFLLDTWRRTWWGKFGVLPLNRAWVKMLMMKIPR
jgi:hypothetical protein